VDGTKDDNLEEATPKVRDVVDETGVVGRDAMGSR
jgi:hypothetical protein